MKKNVLNLVTPSHRPYNLRLIYDSIGHSIPAEYATINWYIVLDRDCDSAFKSSFHDNTFPHINVCISQSIIKSHYGNHCRNIALDLIKDGFIYFLDDDTIMHPEFGKYIPLFKPNKIYTFLSQGVPSPTLRISKNKNASYQILDNNNQLFSREKQSYQLALRVLKSMIFTDEINYKAYLTPCFPRADHIDSSMFCLDRNLMKNIRWNSLDYNADGMFIQQVIQQCGADKIHYIDKTIGYYNFLASSNE